MLINKQKSMEDGELIYRAFRYKKKKHKERDTACRLMEGQ